MNGIDREDMLELTRRMTMSRNCFHRIAGAYFDKDGYVDGTFNIHFQKLTKVEQEQKLKLAKAIPFARTNVELKEHFFPESVQRQGTVWQFLNVILKDDLKNDGLLDIFYEMFGEQYPASHDYGIFFFLGKYDIPRKGTDHASQWESEEVYPFLVCTVCPIDSDYEPQGVESGFLFPAYKNRAGIQNMVNVFGEDEHPEILKILGIRDIESGFAGKN
ncbi:MAG: DUF4317 family protein [Lachnospiraceae bacterium]|nr:DUF4317 family protein [Lachnospiraceae bacterium]